MTDRDKFAAAALTGLLAAPTDKDRSWDYWARLAYEAADAMLARRTKNGTGSGFEAGGPEHHIPKAEIDALQHVVEDGQIVKMWDYARLRRLLIRLRPEWEDEPYEKSDEKRDNSNMLDRLAALERLSALDQELERTHGVRHTQSECTKQGECSVPDSRTENEPVAWLVNGAEYDTGCEYEYVTLIKEKAEIAAENGGNVIPLFDGPRTWQEEVAAVEDAFGRSGVKPTWPDDEPGNIGPMAAAMADEIARLRLTDAEREDIACAESRLLSMANGPRDEQVAATLRCLLERTGGGE